VLITRVPFYIVLCSVICVFCLLVVLVRLSVPVQVIDWKDSSRTGCSKVEPKKICTPCELWVKKCMECDFSPSVL